MSKKVEAPVEEVKAEVVVDVEQIVAESHETGNFSIERIEETSAKKPYISFALETLQDKKALYNATMNPDKKVQSMVNLTINLVNVIVEEITINDPNKGEVIAPRTILIDDQGVTYEAVSLGMISGLERLFSFVGRPNTWEEPMTIRIVEKQLNNNKKMTTFELV